jgi:phospholipid/cholesterol/gamma-HCH transport system substrate-binding protein
MENSSHSIATGVFVLILAVALCAGALWLGGGAIRGEPYDLITQADVAGLSAGATVRLRGVEVGEIRSIDFDPIDPRRVRVRALVKPNVHLLEGTRATIRYLGLSGTGYVELDPPQGASRTLETSATMPARIPLRDSGLAQLTDAGSELVTEFTKTLRRVNGILTPETSRNMSQLIAHLNEAAAGIGVLTHDLEPAARHTDRILENANVLMRTIRMTATDADSVIVGAGAHGGALDAVRDGALETGSAARNVEGALVYDTLPRMDALLEQLSRTSDSLNQLLRQVQSEPQSLVFGLPPRAPGPGEPGFQQAVSR